MDRGSQRESESEKPPVLNMIISWVEKEELPNNTYMRGYCCDTVAFISFDLEILLKAVIDYYSNIILLHLQLSARAVLESNLPATIIMAKISRKLLYLDSIKSEIKTTQHN